jgi:transposase
LSLGNNRKIRRAAVIRMSTFRVPDDLWNRIEPLLPLEPPKPEGGRPRTRPVTLHADKACDIPRCRRYLDRRRITVRIARKGIASSQKPGRRRWVVERTLA